MGDYIFAIVGFTGNTTSNHLVFKGADDTLTQTLYKLTASNGSTAGNTAYTDLLKEKTGTNYTVEQTYVTLVKLDAALGGCTTALINDPIAFQNAIVSHLDYVTGAATALVQNGSVDNENSTPDVGDLGSIALMLKDEDYYSITGATIEGRIRADADSSDGNYRFGSIKDVVKVIELMQA